MIPNLMNAPPAPSDLGASDVRMADGKRSVDFDRMYSRTESGQDPARPNDPEGADDPTEATAEGAARHSDSSGGTEEATGEKATGDKATGDEPTGSADAGADSMAQSDEASQALNPGLQMGADGPETGTILSGSVGLPLPNSAYVTSDAAAELPAGQVGAAMGEGGGVPLAGNPAPVRRTAPNGAGGQENAMMSPMEMGQAASDSAAQAVKGQAKSVAQGGQELAQPGPNAASLAAGAAGQLVRGPRAWPESAPGAEANPAMLTAPESPEHGLLRPQRAGGGVAMAGGTMLWQHAAQMSIAMRAERRAGGLGCEDDGARLQPLEADPLVRVGDAGPAGAMPTPGVAQRSDAGQVIAQMSTAIQRNGPGQVDVALNPPELGRMRISLDMFDGGVVISVSAEKPETMELIRRHIDQLEQELKALGYDSLAFSFGSGEPSDRDLGPPPEPGSGTAAPDAPSPDALPIRGAAHPGSVRDARGRIDIRL